MLSSSCSLPLFSSLPLPLRYVHSHSCFTKPSCSSLPHHLPPPDDQSSDNQSNYVLADSIGFNLRTQNSKSTSLLLHRLSNSQLQSPQDLEPPVSEEEKVKLLELSLVRKRTPQFPGSIYVQSPSDSDVGSSLPPLQSLFQFKSTDENDQKLILRALEIRRTVMAEIFKEAMRKGKFGITYTTNILSCLPDFIDFMMIEAAAMKQSPEFSHATFNLRAKTVIQDSGVVPLIRWLKHNSVSYPQIGKLICISNGKLHNIQRLTEWLKSVHVKGEVVGVTLTKAGRNILERSNEELDEIVEYLEKKGVRRDWMGFTISRCPQLLSYNLEEVKSRVEFYFNLGMNERDFGTMVFDYPRALGFYTLEEMNRKVNYIKEFGLSSVDVGKLLAFRPHLMGCSIEEKLKPLVKYFYYHGISRDGMRRMLMIKPMIFSLDMETTIVPKVQFFKDIGVRDDGISNMLVKFPPLLTYNLYKKIRPVVIFLMTKAGVSEKNIGKVIALGPELLGCSIVHKLEVNVKYFLSLGINYRQLGEMIADFPLLLRYNIDVLRPKYRYLRRTMVRPLQDVIDFPRFFSYSLDGRIIPRHKVLIENRVNFKLRYMLACTDEEFEKKVAAIVERRQRFESGAVENDFLTLQTTDDTSNMTSSVDLSKYDTEEI